MKRNIRKKVSVSILTALLPCMHALAKRNKWELDDVIEEAFIHYLECEWSQKIYTGRMKTKTQSKVTNPSTMKKTFKKSIVKKIEGSKVDMKSDTTLARKLAKKSSKKK